MLGFIVEEKNLHDDFAFFYENTYYSNSVDYSESRIKISVLASFPAIGRFFSSDYPLLDAGENPENAQCTCHWRLSVFSEAAFGTMLEV